MEKKLTFEESMDRLEEIVALLNFYIDAGACVNGLEDGLLPIVTS